jgi:hypothetical protein
MGRLSDFMAGGGVEVEISGDSPPDIMAMTSASHMIESAGTKPSASCEAGVHSKPLPK